VQAVDPVSGARACAAIRGVKEIAELVDVQEMTLAQRRAFGDRECTAVFADERIDAFAEDPFAQHLFAKLDEVVGGRNRDEERAFFSQHARTLVRPTTTVERHDQVDAAIAHRQPSIGVRHEPCQIRESACGHIDGGCGQVDPDCR